MPISCHFQDCKALLVTSLTHVWSAVASICPLPFLTVRDSDFANFKDIICALQILFMPVSRSYYWNSVNVFIDEIYYVTSSSTHVLWYRFAYPIRICVIIKKNFIPCYQSKQFCFFFDLRYKLVDVSWCAHFWLLFQSAIGVIVMSVPNRQAAFIADYLFTQSFGRRHNSAECSRRI